MANKIRIKRRAAGGAPGAPASLDNAELAYNEVDDVLYYGKGTGGVGGTATQAIPIAGPGFAAGQAATAAPLMDGAAAVGASAKLAREDHVHPTDTTRAPLASPALTGTPTVPTAAVDTNTTQAASTAFVLGQAATAASPMNGAAAVGTSKRYARQDHVHATDTSRAPLASPALTGIPTVPTAAPGTNTTQAANTAFVQAAVAALVAASPAALDTLNELSAALGNDANFATTVSASLGLKMAKAANLSDLADPAAARGNLGLQSMATQAANAVAITGGTIDGIDVDGGAF